GRLGARALGFGLPDMRGEDGDDRAHDLILDGKDVFELAVVVLSPSVSSGHGVDQLRGDAEAIPAPTHAALQHIAYPQIAPHIADIGRLALVLEARVAGDDEQLREARQLGDDVLGDAVAQVILLLVSAKIGEGEYGNRRRIRQWQRSLLGAKGDLWFG